MKVRICEGIRLVSERSTSASGFAAKTVSSAQRRRIPEVFHASKRDGLRTVRRIVEKQETKRSSTLFCMEKLLYALCRQKNGLHSIPQKQSTCLGRDALYTTKICSVYFFAGRRCLVELLIPTTSHRWTERQRLNVPVLHE